MSSLIGGSTIVMYVLRRLSFSGTVGPFMAFFRSVDALNLM